jgi:recombination protein RecA
MQASISTGFLGLDIAIGPSRIPRGHLAEIYGPEKCGKTALCLSICSEAQKSAGTTAYIDIDQTLDASRAACFGVDLQQLIYARPESTFQALEVSRILARSGALALVVIDSVNGLLLLGNEGSENARGNPGSRLLSQSVRELSVIAAETGTSIIFTNQLRERTGFLYGVPETTPGGIALKLHAAVRLEMIPREQIRSGFNILGERIQVRVVKPKSTAPFSTTFINIMYNNGEVSRLDHLFNLGVDLKFIYKRGASYFYNEHYLGRGREVALSSLHAQPRLVEQLESAMRSQFTPSSATPKEEDRI